MDLLFAVLHLDRQLIEGVFRQPSGRLRRIEVNWVARERTPVPPFDWDVQMETEISMTDAYDLAVAKGRFVP